MPELYSGLNDTKCTIFLRQTGDNYRSFRLPTEQMSFCLLSLKKMVGSPNGHIINCLWRGCERYQYFEAHCSTLFSDLDHLVRNGIKLVCSGQPQEQPGAIQCCNNLRCRYLPHAVRFGRARLTAKYGCFRCMKSIDKSSNLKLPIANRITVEEIVGLGKKALEVLGPQGGYKVHCLHQLQSHSFWTDTTSPFFHR